MSISNGNAYLTWGINVEGQIFAVDTDNQVHAKSDSSNPAFLDIGISEDGHVWALSHEPHPNGGGAKIYWSIGDGNWNEITTDAPGAANITGFTTGSCLYITDNNTLRYMDIDGNSDVVYNERPVFVADYGGGYIWTMFGDTAGERISLHLSKGDDIHFTPYNENQFYYPRSLSVNTDGDCYGVVNHCAVHFKKDGTSLPGGLNLCGKTLAVSYKSWKYALGTHASEKGNDVFVWTGEPIEGKFIPTGYSALKILSSYHKH